MILFVCWWSGFLKFWIGFFFLFFKLCYFQISAFVDHVIRVHPLDLLYRVWRYFTNNSACNYFLLSSLFQVSSFIDNIPAFVDAFPHSHFRIRICIPAFVDDRGAARIVVWTGSFLNFEIRLLLPNFQPLRPPPQPPTQHAHSHSPSHPPPMHSLQRHSCFPAAS